MTVHLKKEIAPPRSPRVPGPRKVTRICGNLATSAGPSAPAPTLIVASRPRPTRFMTNLREAYTADSDLARLQLAATGQWRLRHSLRRNTGARATCRFLIGAAVPRYFIVS